jgi:hypothetical protein
VNIGLSQMPAAMDDQPTATLDQKDIERWFRERHGVERWTTIYQRGRLAQTSLVLYSCLLPLDRIDDALKDPSWDLMISRGGPGFSQEWDGGTYRTTYLRPNEPDGIEPIVLERTFRHGRPTYVEISEELRLLFDLYEDRQSGIFYQVEEDGLETPVIRTAPDKVTLRTTLLRRYLAARQVALVLQIASDVWLVDESVVPTSELPAERRVTTQSEILHFYSGHFSANRPFSCLLGKKIVLPPPREECDIWPFRAPKEYLDFIIDEDERGRPVEHSCNPEGLANNFGKNPDAPHYLTRVFFQREVLRKYYENSDQYEVGDGDIECQGMWHLRVDNNHPEHVVVFLGDLGRDLPTSEQRHWRHYNIKPEE